MYWDKWLTKRCISVRRKRRDYVRRILDSRTCDGRRPDKASKTALATVISWDARLGVGRTKVRALDAVMAMDTVYAMDAVVAVMTVNRGHRGRSGRSVGRIVV